jgi:hypothetical protein
MATRDAKVGLAAPGWAVVGAELMDAAANDYGRPFQGLPPIFERLMRPKFFTATRTR